MGIVHAVRSDNSNFSARFSWGGSLPGLILQSSGVNTPLYGVDTAAGVVGLIGTTSINMDRGAGLARTMYWNSAGIEHFGGSTTRAVSIVLRARLGVQSAATGLFTRDGNLMNWGANRIAVALTTTNGISISAMNEFGQACLAGTIATAAVTTTSYHDFAFVWDGSTAAGAARFWFDGTQVGSLTATLPLNTNFRWSVCGNLGFGGVSGANNTRIWVNEFLTWNETIDVTSVALADGTTASLNGTGRTSFVNVSPFDYIESGPVTASDVRSGVNYTIHGTAYVGTYAPAPVTVAGTSGGAQPGIGWPEFL